MKKLLVSILVSVTAFANTLTIGDTLPTLTINDQFEKAQTIQAETKIILVAADKDTSTIIKEYLLTKKGDFLSANNAYYIADISGMPSLIARFFALPKMKKYPFSVLLLDDSNKDKFSMKEEKITVYKLKDSKISEIMYISNTKELDAIFK